MRNKENKNMGFTLLEIILSMAILAIISIPLLNYFVHAAKYNHLARKKQEASLIAQNIMEDLKNEENLDSIVNKYKTLPSWEDKSIVEKSVHYVFSQTKEMDGRWYEATIDLQSEKIKQDENADVKLDAEPDFQLLDAANDVIAIEKSLYKESAKLYFLSLNAVACEKKYEQGLTSVPLTEEMLNLGLQRKMYINFLNTIEDGMNYMNTQVIYEYHYSSALGGFAEGIKKSDVYSYQVLSNRMPIDRKRNIYFFYNPTSNDRVVVSGADFNKIDRIYFVSQNKEGVFPLHVEGLSLELESNRQHVYTNAFIENAPGCQSLVSKKEAVRMIRITVAIEPYVMLTSTKGE